MIAELLRIGIAGCIADISKAHEAVTKRKPRSFRRFVDEDKNVFPNQQH